MSVIWDDHRVNHGSSVLKEGWRILYNRIHYKLKICEKESPADLRSDEGPSEDKPQGGEKESNACGEWMAHKHHLEDNGSTVQVYSFPGSVSDSDSPDVRTAPMCKDRFCFVASKCGGWMANNYRSTAQDSHRRTWIPSDWEEVQVGDRERKRTVVQTLRGSSSE